LALDDNQFVILNAMLLAALIICLCGLQADCHTVLPKRRTCMSKFTILAKWFAMTGFSVECPDFSAFGSE